MIDYSVLVGRPWKWGEHDCIALLRDFYKLAFDIELPDPARPHNFFSENMDLYGRFYAKFGFHVLDCHPTDYQFGDVILMAIGSKVPNHCAILVENGRILHQFLNNLSGVTPYKGMWRNSTVGVFRHRDAVLPAQEQTAEIREYLSPNTQRRIDAALRSLSA